MLKSIRIQNFQSHKDTILHFHPGLNAIFGDTDQGKSSVVRAFRWVSKNRPVGAQAYRSTFTTPKEPTRVTIVCDDGEVTKTFLNGKTTYKVKIGKKSLTLKGFGTKTPRQVEELLNLDEVSLQEQFDQPFLTSQSSGAASRHLNRVANLDTIDTTLSNLQSSMRRNLSEIKNTQQEIVEYEKQIKELLPYKDKLKEAVTLEKLYVKFTKTNGKLNELKSIRDQLFKIELELENIPDVDDLNQQLYRIERDRKNLYQTKEHITDIRNISQEINSKTKRIKEINKELKVKSNKLPKECPECGTLLK